MALSVNSCNRLVEYRRAVFQGHFRLTLYKSYYQAYAFSELNICAAKMIIFIITEDCLGFMRFMR